MNFDFAKARNLMVENQLRPNKIKNPIILNLFKHTKKQEKYGGSERNRTAVQGFAGPYITTLPPSQFVRDN